MKVKVRKWPFAHPGTPALDAWFLWRTGKMPGPCFERIALRHGRENYLYNPSHHGELCPSNGENGIECRCDECPHYLTCFPEEGTECRLTLTPSDHGETCIGNGEFPGIGCLCVGCEFAATCFPELNESL